MKSSERNKRRSGGRNKLRRFQNIESVTVEESLEFFLPSETADASNVQKPAPSHQDQQNVGDGCYISAIMNNSSRYYGLLVSQEALKAASLLHFREEAESLDLNRRMKVLQDVQPKEEESSLSPTSTKRQKIDHNTTYCVPKSDSDIRAVQKFQYLPNNNARDPGHRILLATYINAAAAGEGDSHRSEEIDQACRRGGDFVGNHFYAYEIRATPLIAENGTITKLEDGVRTSLGFPTFLQETPMPAWFPLCNLPVSQHKVLSMLQMKRNSKGKVVWDENSSQETRNAMAGAQVVMNSRSTFRVGIVGGGIAGLACAKELLRLAAEEEINVEVVLLEGRSRLGGRLLTDYSTFTMSDGSSFPVDLGASWIHGIDHNPLAVLAKQANIDFVTTGEEVKMIKGNFQLVNKVMDDDMGKLFDDLLDQAVESVWDTEDKKEPDGERNQKAVRWYAKTLKPRNNSKNDSCPQDTPSHRYSSDISVDQALGQAIAIRKMKRFRNFGEDEHALLMWNAKNIEYALGANLEDLSMMYWDSDDRHAFEGDHVLLKQGYSEIVNYMEIHLRACGDVFKCELNYPVSRIEYARSSTSESYPSSSDYARPRRLLDLSDTCSVVSRNGERTENFDFVVSTLPLGVLKASVEAIHNQEERNDDDEAAVIFDPPLPFSKVDAIENAGFGLLNKVYLQFECPFWRNTILFDKDGQSLFGNASRLHPHHYMFHDIGMILSRDEDKPPILMSFVSGKEALSCEHMHDDQIVEQVMTVLRKLLNEKLVSDPIAYKVTRWGSDPFSRGSYTFLPPGATDQDFHVLQSPINGNGDSLLLEGSETMRLFWAGEHTTALHPSTAHGALLSGLRAAEQVMSTILLKNDASSGFEKIIPMAIFRKNNPSTKLQCSLCHRYGSRIREGSLIAFQKGARQLLVHNNCGENSPEVEVQDGKWKHVIKAVNRGRQIKCFMCNNVGATIGCANDECTRCYHFSCGEDTGWNFDRDGKEFFCDLHRKYDNWEENACDPISFQFYKSKRPNYKSWQCAFCGESDSGDRCGKILAFSQATDLMVVHDYCARYTNVMETLEDPSSLQDKSFKNLFEVSKRSKVCEYCGKDGATITCSDVSCSLHFHFPCAQKCQGWNFMKNGTNFRCRLHRQMKQALENDSIPSKMLDEEKSSFASGPLGQLQHNLFLSGAERVFSSEKPMRSKSRTPVAVNDEVWTREATSFPRKHFSYELEDTDSSIDAEGHSDDPDHFLIPLKSPLYNEAQIVDLTASRLTLKEAWEFELYFIPDYYNLTGIIRVEFHTDSEFHGKGKDHSLILCKIDHEPLGSEDLMDMKDVIQKLSTGKIVILTVMDGSNVMS